MPLYINYAYFSLSLAKYRSLQRHQMIHIVWWHNWIARKTNQIKANQINRQQDKQIGHACGKQKGHRYHIVRCDVTRKKRRELTISTQQDRKKRRENYQVITIKIVKSKPNPNRRATPPHTHGETLLLLSFNWDDEQWQKEKKVANQIHTHTMIVRKRLAPASTSAREEKRIRNKNITVKEPKRGSRNAPQVFTFLHLFSLFLSQLNTGLHSLLHRRPGSQHRRIHTRHRHQHAAYILPFLS